MSGANREYVDRTCLHDEVCIYREEHMRKGVERMNKSRVCLLYTSFGIGQKHGKTDFCQFETADERQYCFLNFSPFISVSSDESGHLDGRWKGGGRYT